MAYQFPDPFQNPAQIGAVYHVDCDLGGGMKRVTTPVIYDNTRLKNIGRLMTEALEAGRQSKDIR